MGGMHKGEEWKTNNTWQKKKKLRGIREFEEYLKKKISLLYQRSGV